MSARSSSTISGSPARRPTTGAIRTSGCGGPLGPPALGLAPQPERPKFGCAFNVLPMWHPIRLAEDYAMADIVTDGRVIMGIGRGYHTREGESFGAPLLDAAANREYFEEQLKLLLACFNEEAFHFKGKYFEAPPPVDYRGYRLKDLTLGPRAKDLPGA